MSPPTPDETLDLYGVPCPQNTARALMSLEFMEPGQVLALTLDDGEPMENVPPALALEGHQELARERTERGWRLWVRCGIDGDDEDQDDLDSDFDEEDEDLESSSGFDLDPHWED